MEKMVIAAVLMVAASGAFASQQLEAKVCANYATLAGDYYKMKSIGMSKLVVVNHFDSIEGSERARDAVRPMVDRLFSTNMSPIAFINWSTEYCLKNVIPDLRRRRIAEEQE